MKHFCLYSSSIRDIRHNVSGKVSKTIKKLAQDWDSLLAFYDLPAEHRRNVHTATPIESAIATMQHRTARAGNCLWRVTFLGRAFKLLEEAEKAWRNIRGADRIQLLLNDVLSKEGLPARGNLPGE